MTSGVSIRRASFADCDHLAMVGAAAYVAAYAHVWASAAPLSHFLRTFAPDRFEALVEDPAAYLWLAQSEGEIVGFLSMLVGSHDPIFGEPGGAEIPRLYLLPGARGQGLGRRLMKAAESNARQLGLAYLWLDAMESAAWATGTYPKWGFEQIGTARFPHAVLPAHAGMLVFKKRLNGKAPAAKEDDGARMAPDAATSSGRS